MESKHRKINGGGFPARRKPETAHEDAKALETLLADSRLRSRFIRELEIQAIAGRSPEELAQRYRGEELFAGRNASYYQPSQSNLIW